MYLVLSHLFVKVPQLEDSEGTSFVFALCQAVAFYFQKVEAFLLSTLPKDTSSVLTGFSFKLLL